MDKELLIDPKEFASIESNLSLISQGLDFTQQAANLLEGAGTEDDPRKLDSLILNFECVCASCGVNPSDSGGMIIESNESFSSVVGKIRAFIKRMIDAIIKSLERVTEWIVTVFTRTSMARGMMKDRATATLKKLTKFSDRADIVVKVGDLTKVENLLENWKLSGDYEKSFQLIAKLIELIRPDANLVKDYDQAVRIVVDELRDIAEHNNKQAQTGGDDYRGYYSAETFVRAIKLIHNEPDRKRWLTNLIPTADILAASNLPGQPTDYRIVGYTLSNHVVLGKLIPVMGMPDPMFSGYYWGRIPKPSRLESGEKTITLSVKQARAICTSINSFVDAIDPVEKEYLKISRIALRPLLTAKKLADSLESNEEAARFAGLLRMFESMVRAAVVFPAQLSSIGMRSSFSAVVLIERGLIDLEI